jgi:hypothetical protein
MMWIYLKLSIYFGIIERYFYTKHVKLVKKDRGNNGYY